MDDFFTLASSDICRTPAFHDDFKQLTGNELAPNGDGLSDDQVQHLLESCSVLSLSHEDYHQRLAYKIAVYLLRQKKEEYEIVPLVAQLVMTRLGDLPTIDYMVSNGDAPDYFHYFRRDGPEREMDLGLTEAGLTIRFPEILERKAFNQIQIGREHSLVLTSFQALVLRLLEKKHDLVFSAPTSAGKSYVLLNYLAQRMFSSPSLSALYIVPTKALVAEIQVEIKRTLDELGILGHYQVFTGASILNREEIARTDLKVLVLTQERLQEMLADGNLNFRVDLLVVDEAQQVANESRGIIIEDAVEELIKKEPNMQKILVSPYVRDLEKIARIFGVSSESLATRYTNKSPVAHNIFYVTFNQGKPRHHGVTISVLLQELQEDNKENVELRTMNVMPREMKRLPGTITSRKVWVAKNLVRKNEPTLIYCNTRADCRKVCGELAVERAEETDEHVISQELKEAISFIKEHVHSQYYLADFLEHRIGYHYGVMPQFVRFRIKQLFVQKQILYLACTSTLLEGVNLPAKNLILYKPKRGTEEPMDTLSIRNLAGRAGRLLKDYYGNVYCIDKERWDLPPDEAFEDRPEIIESSSVTTLSKDASELIHYLRDEAYEPTSSRAKSIKSMATSLLMKQLMYPETDFLSKYKGLSEQIDQADLNTIRSLLVEVTTAFSPTQRNVILKNRSIDPRFQCTLYQILKKPSERVLPTYPGNPTFYKNLKAIFQLVAKYLLKDASGSHKHYSYVADLWIRETRYKQILQGQIEYEKTHNHFKFEKPKAEINRIIEELDKDLEDMVRFDYTRGLKCYSNILEEIASEENRPMPPAYCPFLSTFLEAGASDKRVLFLIGSGLSRTVAIEISRAMETLPKWDSLAETMIWLRANRPILKEKIHPLLFEEVERIIGRQQVTMGAA